MIVLKEYSIIAAINGGKVCKCLDKQIRDSGHITGFDGYVADGDKLFVSGTAWVDQPALELLLLNHVAMTKDIIKASYIQKEMDGRTYCDEIRADMVEQYMNLTLTEANLYDIEDRLEKVSSRIKSGDWMSAKNKMVTAVTVGGSLSQAFYDQVLAYIDNYITTNY